MCGFVIGSEDRRIGESYIEQRIKYKTMKCSLPSYSEASSKTPKIRGRPRSGQTSGQISIPPVPLSSHLPRTCDHPIKKNSTIIEAATSVVDLPSSWLFGVQLSIAISKDIEEISVLKRIIACKTGLFIQPGPHFKLNPVHVPIISSRTGINEWPEVIAAVIVISLRPGKKRNLTPSHFSFSLSS